MNTTHKAIGPHHLYGFCFLGDKIFAIKYIQKVVCIVHTALTNLQTYMYVQLYDNYDTFSNNGQTTWN